MSEKKTILTLLLYFATLITTAQIRGTVSDENGGIPLSGAHILLLENKKLTTSDYNGRFRFRDVEAGPYTLRITHIGYQEMDHSFDFDGSVYSIDFGLKPRTYEAEEAVVTGSRIEVSRHNNPMTVSVITAEELNESGESAILPAISKRVPGVFVTERGITGFGVSGGAAGKISIRGIGGDPNTRVLMLIDGQPQFMGLFGHPLPDSYVTSDAEKVEVIRGPASLLYGSNAMGGVINIITKKQRSDGFTGDARASFGSFLTQKYMGSAGYKKKNLTVFASVNHDETQGHRDNSEFYITNGFLKVGYQLSAHWKAKLDGSVAKFKSCDPGPANRIDSSYLTKRHWVDILRGMGSFSLENNHSHAEGAVKLFYNFGVHDIYDGFHSTDHNYGLTAYEGLRLFKNNTITLGIDYKQYGGVAENTEAMMGKGIEFVDTSVYELGTYIFAQQGFWDRLVITAGIRLENNEMFGSEWIPQFGASYLPFKTSTIKASASKGFRSPTIRELFLWDAANPDLKPESMWNYEMGWMQSFPDIGLNTEITGYLSEGENLIQLVGQYPNVTNENTGAFKHYGLEFQAGFQITQALLVNANYAYLHMDTPITGAPVNQCYVGGRYRLDKFTFHADMSYINKLYTRVNPVKNTQEYFLLNARISWQAFPFLQFFVSGENLLDQAYQINDDYPMPGITLFGGIHFSYRPDNNQ